MRNNKISSVVFPLLLLSGLAMASCTKQGAENAIIDSANAREANSEIDPEVIREKLEKILKEIPVTEYPGRPRYIEREKKRRIMQIKETTKY
jgi:hypothetical protein